MKFTDILFILFVILILFGMTAIRYRKQIAGMIGFARMLKEAKESAMPTRTILNPDPAGVRLVHCAKCGVWVPQSKARKVGSQSYCSDDCVAEGRA